jgi:hypothetical protein
MTWAVEGRVKSILSWTQMKEIVDFVYVNNVM